MGDVISESAQLALSWVKSNAYELGLALEKKDDVMRDIDLHLHLPAGSVKKDGPSAGVALVLSMVSLLSGHALNPTLAMTGEITLRGKVTPVGGIKEKVLAAHRAGIKHVMLPLCVYCTTLTNPFLKYGLTDPYLYVVCRSNSRNRKDIIADLPNRVKEDIQVSYVEDIWQALEVGFGDKLWHPAPEAPPRRRGQGYQVTSRL